MSVLQMKHAPVAGRRPRGTDDNARVAQFPNAGSTSTNASARAPALAVAAFFAAGILLDGRAQIVGPIWLAAGLLTLVGWGIAYRCRFDRMAGLCLLSACLAIGGARYHLTMDSLSADDISLFARDDPKPVRVIGTVATTPDVQRRRSDRNYGRSANEPRTTFQLRCRSIDSSGSLQDACGMASVTLNGTIAGLDIGDTLDIRGSLSHPAPPGNPGEFDYRQYLERHGTRCKLYIEYPEAVEVLQRGSKWSPNLWLGNLRARCEKVCRRNLSPETAPVAAALLLGSRTQIDDNVRDAFARTATAHILAISGLNVAILAGVLFLVCRLLNLGEARAGWLTLIFVFTYAILTGASPPVVRAAVLIGVLVVGRVFRRRSFHENSLAVAAIIVLAWNPADLFDVGAQLSFLAVAVISWSTRFFNSLQYSVENDPLAGFGRSQFWRTARDWTAKGYFVTACIWLATTPLLAATFHLVSPVGLVINVVLMPLVTLVLWAGYAFLFCGLIIPPLTPALGSVFDSLLSVMLWIVDAAARVELSHFYVLAPPTWWLAGFYLLLAPLLYLSGNSFAANPTPGRFKPTSAPKRLLTARNGWRLFAIWVIVGLVVALIPPKRDGLRCTFLSVGHGCSVLVEFPNGRTLLYDAGSLDGERSAERRIEGALWDRGVTRLDAIVISHADIDHFNAVPRLLGTFRTNSLITSRLFLDFEQLPVRETCETAFDQNVPIRLISSGDRLLFDESATVEVLHPRIDFRSAKDNATSVVLAIGYGGRRILLTGDLEGTGLDELLTRDSMKVDVLLSPHHGSKAANPAGLAAWGQGPQIVVASSGRKNLTEALEQVYGERVYSTADTGAVTVQIAPSGEIRESHFRVSSERSQQ